MWGGFLLKEGLGEGENGGRGEWEKGRKGEEVKG